MKKYLGRLLLFAAFFLLSGGFNLCLADGPQPPGPPVGHGLNENQGPFDAPVGDGYLILVILALGYAAYLYMRIRIKSRKLAQ